MPFFTDEAMGPTGMDTVEAENAFEAHDFVADRGWKQLASGTLVEPVENKFGQTIWTPVTCDWLVEVPSGHPEPDFPSDLWITVECGAKLKRHPEFPEHGSICDHGHDRLPIEITWTDPRFF